MFQLAGRHVERQSVLTKASLFIMGAWMQLSIVPCSTRMASTSYRTSWKIQPAVTIQFGLRASDKSVQGNFRHRFRFPDSAFITWDAQSISAWKSSFA